MNSPKRDTGSARCAVFLDRDGVLNAAVIRDGRPYPPPSVAEMRLLPGVEDACSRLKRAGFLLIAVTNQPDIARGKTTNAAVEAINRSLQTQLGLDEVRVCPHDDADGCDCRKPKPGLLLAAAQRWNIDLARSFMVGDRWRDVEAGRAAGCRTVFIDYGYNERRPAFWDMTAISLAEAVPMLVATTRPEGITTIAEGMTPVPNAAALKVQVFADGADKARFWSFMPTR